MSGVQLKDSALKAKEKSNEPATTTTTTAATTIGKKTLTSSAALSLFDQLKNGVNLNSLTVGGATETTKATAATAAAATTGAATTATTATLAPPATPPPNIDLKPPPKPLKASTATRTFNTPILLPPTSSIGIVHGTKRGRDNGNSNDSDNCAAPATLSHCRTAAAAAAKLDINALRSQLYQGARKTATTTTKTTTTATAATSTKRTTATTTTTTAATRGDRGGIKKKRCLDRYDSSESSDRYVELSLIQLKV
ncbi:mucin-19-like isoform X2 [Drosophila nasuta]|uniref:mucin-19-like isoform X2 n=1 Tax=Drosophila nasuta TaxID=42062 RepID=UPI00295E7F13|nr:mucin-19-like isoform X2 [Drosophila nasuta]